MALDREPGYLGADAPVRHAAKRRRISYHSRCRFACLQSSQSSPLRPRCRSVFCPC